MNERQIEAVAEKLREAESLLLSLITAEPKNDALHDSKIHIWKAIDKLTEAAHV